MKCPKCHFDNPPDTIYCGKCATPLKPSEEISISQTKTLETTIDELTRGATFASRYEIIEELGKGGMGKVYRVFDKRIKEEVALKLLKPEIAADKKTIERFSNELKFARKITHKNVCRMHDLHEEGGTQYITMEYVPGEDLKSTIRRMEKLTVGKAVSIAKQVCEGLIEAHKLGVVHRDLKPQNIMIDKEGNAKIMDFGIARSLKAKGITGAGVMIGTPEYMSPEQVEGKEADQRSDIYSLGVIIYEMVTGRVPFEGDTPFSIAYKHKNEVPQDPSRLNAQVPSDLSQVILRCMEKDKEKRNQSVEELLVEFSKIEEAIPTTERVVPKRKPITSKEITVTFGLKKLIIPSLAIIALAIAIVIIWRFLPKEKVPVTPSKPSIAVLPFTDLSPQKDQEYFCDGMMDEIIAKLSRLGGLKVISRTSVMLYKNTDKDIKAIGQELDVATILEGSVRKEKDYIRITAQLVNVEDRFHIWADTYESKIERVFEIQNDTAEKIAEALNMKLSLEEKEQIQKKPTENMEAYNLCLLGKYHWNKWTQEGAKKARHYYEEAIKEDPEYAAAYVGLAESYYQLGSEVGSLSPREAYPLAKRAVARALEIDETLGEAHTALGVIKCYYDWDWLGAEGEFKRGIELSPNSAVAHEEYSLYLAAAGRLNEAVAEAKRSLELDPLSIVTSSDVGWYFILARQYDQALQQLKKTIELDPNFPIAYWNLGFAYLMKGMIQEAIEASEKAVTLSDDQPAYKANLGSAYAKANKEGKALRILEELKQLSKIIYVPAAPVAWIYIGLEENDLAFEWLDKAYEERDAFLVWIKVDPVYDSLRSEPRFKTLLKKVGLEK